MHSALPAASWYSPFSHLTQGPLPGSALCVPAGHAEHSPPSGPVNPALHVQLVTMSAPSDNEADDDGQSKQAALPAVSLYVPAEHAEHSPPSGPVYPAMHSQSVTLSLPSDDEAVVDGQAKHSVLPVSSLYLPGAHASQS